MSRLMERMLQLLEEIRDNTETGSGVSSIEIEDLASKKEPKLTTKFYKGVPLTWDEIDRALEAHAYAKRRVNDMAMHDWETTVEMLKAQRRTPAHFPTGEEYQEEELPDFEEIKR